MFYLILPPWTLKREFNPISFCGQFECQKWTFGTHQVLHLYQWKQVYFWLYYTTSCSNPRSFGWSYDGPLFISFQLLHVVQKVIHWWKGGPVSQRSDSSRFLRQRQNHLSSHRKDISMIRVEIIDDSRDGGCRIIFVAIHFVGLSLAIWVDVFRSTHGPLM